LATFLRDVLYVLNDDPMVRSEQKQLRLPGRRGGSNVSLPVHDKVVANLNIRGIHNPVAEPENRCFLAEFACGDPELGVSLRTFSCVSRGAELKN
jgi:hypothetical protein